jgi:predicted nucleic acid-binding protein
VNPLILVDTNVLVALVDPRDPCRQRVLADQKTLAGQRLALTSVVLSEAGFFLRHPVARAKLRTIIQELEMLVYPLPDEAGLWSELFDWVQKYHAHAPDFVDAFLVILTSRDRKLKVWTYDSEFWTIWRRPDGSAIPLAVKPK